MVGQHFTINKSSEVPRFLEKAADELADVGKVRAEIWDIEGCYPNMNKETIRSALRKVVKDLPFTQRRATLTACLRKVHKMASDVDILRVSAMAKIAEFRRLRYPVGLL